jgi:hypothetical protein
MGGDAFVGEVCNGFGEGTKIWWRFPIGRTRGKASHQVFIGQCREGDAEDGHVGRAQPDAVEAIREVVLKHVDRAVVGGAKRIWRSRSRWRVWPNCMTSLGLSRRVSSFTPEKV